MTNKPVTTGFRWWLALQWFSVLEFICWMIGHKIDIGPWHRSQWTAHTHWRSVTCKRCGPQVSERGYFDALDKANWPGDK